MGNYSADCNSDTRSARDNSHGQSPDHVDAVGRVFAEMEHAYHNQFHKAFPDTESLVIAKKHWLGYLQEYPPTSVIEAIRSIVKSEAYLPSLNTLISYCEQVAVGDAMPDERQAYLEACQAPSPKNSHSWSHAAVYHAGKACGWFFLANESENKSFPLFCYHYRLCQQRLLSGEELRVEHPQALPATVVPRLDSDELQRRIRKLKQELNLK